MAVGNKTFKYIALCLVCVAGLGYLFMTGMKGSMIYYLTLEELQGEKSPRIGDGVRIVGIVKEGSVEGSALDGEIVFIMTDGERELEVFYSGQVPDNFQDGAQIVVEGIYKAKPSFTASTLLAKCPSKYETEDAAEGQEGS